MFNLNGFKIGTALLVLSSTVSAGVVINNQVIPDADIVSINISPSSGTLYINTTVDYDVTRSDGTTPTPPVTAALAISSFTAAPSSFVEGGSTSLQWQTSNAVSCMAADGPATWTNQSLSSVNGSANVTLNAAGSYPFTLTCQGSNNATVSRNLVVNVLTAPVTGGTTCKSDTLNGKTETWAHLWGSEFPGPVAAQKVVGVTKRGYNAYKFNTGSVVDSASITATNLTSSPGAKLGSISACPGDFAVPAACKHSWGIGGGIQWATDGTKGACALQPNTDYYFNITFTNGTDASSATCAGYCEARVQASNYAPR